MTTDLEKTARRLSSIRDAKKALSDLHQLWSPHSGQKILGKKVFYEKCKVLFAQCGRNFGKTNFDVYAAVRYAQLNPGSHVYILGPERKHVAEFVWAPRLLQNMIPSWWIKNPEKDINKSELRITLANESFIKLDGADNPQSLRGYKPHFLVCDEFQGWKRASYEAMEPNLAAKKATVVITGTPPDNQCFFVEFRDFVLNEMGRGNDRYFYLERPNSHESSH